MREDTVHARPYPKYKPSGVEWLGEVPESWGIKRLRYVCRFAYGDSLSSEDREDGDVPVFGSNGPVGTHTVANTRRPVIVVGRKGSHGKVNLSESAVFAIDTTYFIDDRFTRSDLRWLFYVLGTLGLDAVSKDSAVPGLGREDAYAHSVPVPTIEEQRAIADFLDRETAKIDTLVAKKRTLIERLKEKRTALISRTVTRGLPPDAARAASLDPHPKLKPSGIDWLGDVPEHWEVKRLKYLAADKRGNGIQIGPFGGMLTDVAYDAAGDYKVYGQENTLSGNFETGERSISREQFIALSNYHLASGDVLFTRKGSIGGCTVVPVGIQPGIIDSDTIRLRVVRTAVHAMFLLYSFKFSSYLQGQVQEVKRGAILGGLNSSTIANLVFAAPPLNEQRKITAFLESEMAKMNGMIAKVETAIARLQEYRTALISAAVTGKIDMRGAAA